MPSIHSGHWDPVFAAAEETDTILCMHLGSASRRPVVSSDAPASVIINLLPTQSVNSFVELLWSSIWKRFPGLKVSLTEGDIGWIPYFLQRAEHTHEKHGGWTMDTFPNGGGPTDVFRKHFIVCFIDDAVGMRARPLGEGDVAPARSRRRFRARRRER